MSDDEELVLAVYRVGSGIRRMDATEDTTEFRQALAMAVETIIGSPEFTTDLWMEAGRFATLLRGWLPRITRRPARLIVTAVGLEGKGDWHVIEHHDGTTTVVIPPAFEARALELWPGVPVERGPSPEGKS